MRVAVIGSGIAGLASAWLLSRRHGVTLFEANDYLGGHTHTHDIELRGRQYAVDTGFIVFNTAHYPLLSSMFEQLGVASQPTTMSFSVHNAASGLEYNASDLDGLFCQRRNLLSPRFIGMVRDLLRFYRQAPSLLEVAGDGPTLGDYLQQEGFGATFRDEHLLPMASALWSSPSQWIESFPAKYLVQFMANHQMLQVDGRPQWRVVRGGSSTYVKALRARWRVHERIACPVRSVQRREGSVEVASARGPEYFDQVVMACHSDQALALLGDDADPREREILSAMPYQANDVVLHTDASLLPKRRKAWAAWNAYIPREPEMACTVSYCMNLLQGIDAPEPLVVTLNRSDAIDPAKILRSMVYHHPQYSHASVAAQRRKPEIQGRRRTWFAGAYWGWGFHEDGLRSAVEVAEGLGVDWKLASRPTSFPPARERRARAARGYKPCRHGVHLVNTTASNAGAAALRSAVYEGVVRHRRHAPHPHAFDYRMAQLYLDLDELDRLFAHRWLWSADGRNLAQFRRGDYLGPADVPLAEAVRERVNMATGVRPAGPIRLLTHLRYFGHVFNPVSFYYCFDADGTTLECIVAEITNTPWKQRHAYVLAVEDAQPQGRALHWAFPKGFHVSPFMPMDRDYRWRLTAPGEDLHVHMDVLRDGRREFDADLDLQRRPLDGASLARVLWRYPLMTLQVVGAIHWQALRLWLKGNPVHDHPDVHAQSDIRDSTHSRGSQ